MATRPRSGRAILSVVAHRTARVPKPEQATVERRAEATSSPGRSPAAARAEFYRGTMLLVFPAIFGSIPHRSGSLDRCSIGPIVLRLCNYLITAPGNRPVPPKRPPQGAWATVAQGHHGGRFRVTGLEVGAKTAPQIS